MACIRATFSMSFIEGLLNTCILGPQLHMLVIMKGLLSGYNIDFSCIDEAQNANALCIFVNPAYLDLLFFVQYGFFYHSFYHSTSTMAAAGPVRGELMPDIVDQ